MVTFNFGPTFKHGPPAVDGYPRAKPLSDVPVPPPPEPPPDPQQPSLAIGSPPADTPTNEPAQQSQAPTPPADSSAACSLASQMPAGPPPMAQLGTEAAPVASTSAGVAVVGASAAAAGPAHAPADTAVAAPLAHALAPSRGMLPCSDHPTASAVADSASQHVAVPDGSNNGAWGPHGAVGASAAV
jgi:hypothetical protein